MRDSTKPVPPGPSRPVWRSASKPAGFTLIEVLVALIVGAALWWLNRETPEPAVACSQTITPVGDDADASGSAGSEASAKGPSGSGGGAVGSADSLFSASATGASSRVATGIEEVEVEAAVQLQQLVQKANHFIILLFQQDQNIV